MPLRSVIALVTLALALASGCTGSGTPATGGRIVGSQKGIASYYSDKYQGRPTASGEAFDQHEMTAAHRRLPFGTRVRVTNVANGKSVAVRINDRGPFVSGRVIDVSRAAATKLGIIHAGLAQVTIEVLDTPAAVASGS